MQFDQKKPKTQRPTDSNGNTELNPENLQAEVPEVENLVNEIDRLLAKTKKKSGCGCGG